MYKEGENRKHSAKVDCDKIHNPSKRVDPNYWRFFISIKSYKKFTKLIGSWHPIKSRFLRMKI
ncbi:hypothetical protein KKG52_03425 [Patescibacteria group bacterium]|nr:hypothetical protein [Patescibacteria group bacterium]